MTYTIHLLTLRCLKSQEMGGDEPYLKVNGKVVWSWKETNHHFSDVVDETNDLVDVFDFRTSRVYKHGDWDEVDAYSPEKFVFRGLTGATIVELWESDTEELLRGDDDLLGQLTVTETDAGNDELKGYFQATGVDYELTYRVSKDD